MPVWLLASVIVAACAWAYSTSFTGALMNDDVDAIAQNAHLRSLWPPGAAMTAPPDTALAGRPLPTLTFAINYALAPAFARDAMVPDATTTEALVRDNLWGYHAVNLALHVLNGLLLLGVVRRTLLAPPLCDRFGGAATPIAFAASLLWAVHPLQTESVTFLVQRVELLMGLFYLATVYCAIRSAESDFTSRIWTVAAVVSCALGMASKEVMVTAPLFVALWIWVCRPRTRLTGAPRWLLAGLAATWIIPVWLLMTPARSQSVGFGLGGWTAWIYLRTQAAVVVHYLRLAFWPHPLVFHYAWLPAESWLSVLPQTLLLGSLAVATTFALVRRWPIGLTGAWFFLILAPSSSILPIVSEVAAEHRMYLPLAAVVVLVTCGVYAGAQVLLSRPGAPAPIRRWAITGWVVVGVLAATLAWRTSDRNRVYASVPTMTADIVANRPENAQLRLARAMDLMGEQNFKEAEAQLRAALDLPLPLGTAKSVRANMRMQLGLALCSQDRYAECAAEMQQAVSIDPSLIGAFVVLAEAHLQLRQPREALASLDRAIAIDPDAPRPLTRAAVVLSTSSNPAVRNGARAVELATRAVSLTHRADAIAIDALALAYAEVGQFDRAVVTVREAMTVAEQHRGSAYSATLQGQLASFEAKRPIRTPEW